ncbi:terminase large subunit domain-containing protein [Delftia tsuruhatensis]|uniref:phage terminase large subunit family protein n=1 Tax=Delftia tsuruhatensis TaxID=180282 RepID=UPI00202976C0|nr:terminase family protein [Delftia tsuruhatensis]
MKLKGRAKCIPLDREAIFLPFQSEWIKDGSRIKLMEKSRQIGISWSTAYGADERAAAQGARFDEWVSSRDDIQARLFIEDCKLWAGIMGMAAQDMGEVVLDADKKLSAYVLQFASGRRIHSMSSNPDAQAGKRGSRVLDEFALHREQRKMWAIAYPGITWGGSMELISTHRGSYSFFNQLVREARHGGNPKKISLHRVTLQDALDQGFLFKLQQALPADAEQQDMDEAEYFDFTKSGAADAESFDQEYMCIPADDDAKFLEYGLITACEYPGGTDWRRGLQGPFQGNLFAGVDIGRKKDLTVLWVVEQLGDVFYTRHVEVMEKMRKSDQEKILWPWFEICDRICIDSTGLGIGWTDDAQDKFGEHRVEGVSFTGQVKEALAYPLKGAMEDRKIRIPEDPKIRADLRKIQKTTTAAGNIRFVADGDDSTKVNGHADRFWALALALHAGSNPSAPIEFMSGGPRDSSEPLGDFIHG